MEVPRFIDISSWQPPPDQVVWKDYVAWAASFDGVSRVAIRAMEFLGQEDVSYRAYRDGYLAAGGDIIIHYGYAYPQRNNAAAEANFLRQVVGDLAKRPLDKLEVDLEEQAQNLSQWAFEWGTQCNQNYAGRKATLYASDSYIRAHLQDSRLPGVFDLTDAIWTFDPNNRPPCPPPWTSYLYLQYADNVTVPGIGAKVDADLYLGSETPAPPPPPVHLDPLPVVLGSDGDFRLVQETFGNDVRFVVVAKHSSEDKLRKAGYIS